MKQKISQTILL